MQYCRRLRTHAHMCFQHWTICGMMASPGDYTKERMHTLLFVCSSKQNIPSAIVKYLYLNSHLFLPAFPVYTTFACADMVAYSKIHKAFLQLSYVQWDAVENMTWFLRSAVRYVILLLSGWLQTLYSVCTFISKVAIVNVGIDYVCTPSGIVASPAVCWITSSMHYVIHLNVK